MNGSTAPPPLPAPPSVRLSRHHLAATVRLLFFTSCLFAHGGSVANNTENTTTIVVSEQSPPPTVLPPPCFASMDALQHAMDNYLQVAKAGKSSTRNSKVAQKYGWPMDTWCVSNLLDRSNNNTNDSAARSFLMGALDYSHFEESSVSIELNDILAEWDRPCECSEKKTMQEEAGESLDEEDNHNVSDPFPEATSTEVMPLQKQQPQQQQQSQVEDIRQEATTITVEDSTVPSSPSTPSNGEIFLRLFPVKLFAFLLLVSLVFVMRHLLDRRHHSYEGIDPSEQAEKIAEFELLQMAAEEA